MTYSLTSLCKKYFLHNKWWIGFEIIGVILIIMFFVYYLVQHLRKSKTLGRAYTFRGIGDSSEYKEFRRKRRSLSGTSKKEEKCREILQRIYQKPFPSVRPNFLKNPATGMNLELDCYNESLGIALEYDGLQHSVYLPYFHRKGPNEFLYQTKKDQWKTQKAKENNITLIRVPYWVTDEQLETFIRNKLRETGKL